MVDERNKQSEIPKDREGFSGPDIHEREKAIHELVFHLSNSDAEVENTEGQGSSAHHSREEIVRDKNLLHKSGSMAASTRRQYLTAMEAFKVSFLSCTNSPSQKV